MKTFEIVVNLKVDETQIDPSQDMGEILSNMFKQFSFEDIGAEEVILSVKEI